MLRHCSPPNYWAPASNNFATHFLLPQLGQRTPLASPHPNMIRLLRRLLFAPRQPSFRINTKLDSCEFLRRLDRLTWIDIPRCQVSLLIQVLDPSRQLLVKVIQIERQILATQNAVKGPKIGDRVYFTDCVLAFEEVFNDLRELLRRTYARGFAGKGIPEGSPLVAARILTRLNYLEGEFRRVRTAYTSEFLVQSKIAEQGFFRRWAIRTGLLSSPPLPPEELHPQEAWSLYLIKGGNSCQCKEYL